ncbi:MAG: glycosyltransferase family 4 protein [Bacteroidota bacterium]|nr:glycosyltransferase family 4 protein [Bacteroidota bacterium]
MKKVLIITYYWPPAGGSAVYRWLKFSKYLRDFGWEPIVYTAENGEYAELDPENEKDIPAEITILKQPIWEPYDLYKKFIGQKKTEKVNVGFLSEKKKPALAERISVWVRGNFFIPDARCFWVKPSVKYLSAWLEKNPVDMVISSGPPHSMHLIAMALKKRFNLPWIADFRDPWTKIDFYNELHLSALADRKHHRLEKKVATTADHVVTVGNQMRLEFEEIGSNNVTVITNGFDTADKIADKPAMDAKFSIAHFGTVNKARNPELLWQVASELVAENEDLARDLEFKFVGRLDQAVRESMQKYGLEKYLTKVDFLPHKEVIRMQYQSQVLLLLVNQTHNAGGILTGKFFEYLAAERPILAIAPPTGDVADILTSAKAGKVVDFDDREGLKSALLAYFNDFKNSNLNVSPEGINSYSRFELTRKLAGIMDKISK